MRRTEASRNKERDAMKWLAAMILFFPASAVAQVAAGAMPVRLDDLWSGTYQCPMGVPHPETIRISQRGRTLTAVKVTGDPCVPAGMVTWEGTLPRDVIATSDLPLTLRVRVTVGNSRTMSATAGTVTIDSPSHIRLGGGGGVDFTRGASAPGTGPNASLPPQGTASDDGTGMPSVEEVMSKVHGRDPADTLARQVGSFTQLERILNTLPKDRENPHAASNLMRAYMEARGRASRQLTAPADRALAGSYERDDGLRQQMMSMISGRAKQALETRQQAAAAAQQAASEAAEKKALAAQKEKKAEDERERAAAEAK